MDHLIPLLFERAKHLNNEFEIILDSPPLNRREDRLSTINKQLEAIVVIMKGILDDHQRRNQS
jgi:hypothetical protein